MSTEVKRFAILVDVDGVVARPRCGSSWRDGLERDLGIDPRCLQERFFDLYWDDVVRGRTDLFRVLGPALESMGSNVTARCLTEYWFEQDANLDHALLERLANLRCDGHVLHLVTNQEHHRARHLWETLGLSRLFDAMHHSSALGFAKPEREFFRLVSQAVPNFSTMRPLLIDDQAGNVNAAREMGWQALLWNGGADFSSILQAIEKAG